MKQLVFGLISCVLLISCTQNNISKNNDSFKKSDQIYQYSVFTALANKIYDGDLEVARVKKLGDMGLGTFNGLNGEMIILDGKVFQFLANGQIKEAMDNQKVPFVVTTFFENDQIFQVTEMLDYDGIKKQIEGTFESPNFGYAIKIKGNFNYIKCGSAPRQKKPYLNTLSEALVNRPTFEGENIQGTMVGFWFPNYVGKVNVHGFHLHFISEDKTFAGHVLDFKSDNLNVGMDRCNGFNIELPKTIDFENADFDLNQGYNKK
jgi:acetolactate decarboxylase